MKRDREDVIQGLELGADDFVPKPFVPRELVSRVKAVVRRSRFLNGHEEPAFQLGDLTVDFAHNRVTLSNEDVVLSGTEYKLLTYLARNPGRILSPDQILEGVWGQEYMGEPHLVRVYISRLRQKLSFDGVDRQFITTRHGIGYGLTRASNG